ncbi:3-oxoacyl-[acyl-carrier-protein] reductase FabG [Methyloligella halotolerans]|uniref:3-oxoacyl-[acyl-carrier-protein] reductase FabG n=1 Tax=Methyloligella halotolerans TaxID=1177755 RepID=A0A1E2RYZ4_9HYPH|nr:SDR family NAD(P)-dependent oxidoreductase [Methyloligella halotolerans]ODA67372.1 3-oxoacyl-[acyl-carrier-protein] reductase FabG [Methyloligella halotolerans]
MQIEGAIALVTGANRGIGLALVQALAEGGARHIYGTARNPESFPPGELPPPAQFSALRLDLSDGESIEDVAALANDVTLLINNAGSLSGGALLAAPPEAIRGEMATNCFGLIEVTRLFAPVIARNGGGVILNMLSVSSLASAPDLGIYATSKAAAWAATQAMRTSLAADNIRVLSAFPGPVDTDMSSELEVRKASPGSVAEALIAGIEREDPEIFPDDMARQAEAVWRSDPAMLIRQFSVL